MTAGIALLDLTLPSPEENLALEEALLERAEATGRAQVLRFWESPSHFVVLGAGCKAADDAYLDRCAADNVPVLRRCSGGGTVLQGPGCLNFTLVVDSQMDPALRAIDSTNRYILGHISRALQQLDVAACCRGTSDLAYGEHKISGTAQRRKKRFILFHGTLLHAMDIALVSRYLREPDKRPDYRAERDHAQFVRNIGGVMSDDLKRAVAEEWNAAPQPYAVPHDFVRQLVEEKYSRDEWNRRF